MTAVAAAPIQEGCQWGNGAAGETQPCLTEHCLWSLACAMSLTDPKEDLVQLADEMAHLVIGELKSHYLLAYSL